MYLLLTQVHDDPVEGLGPFSDKLWRDQGMDLDSKESKSIQGLFI